MKIILLLSFIFSTSVFGQAMSMAPIMRPNISLEGKLIPNPKSNQFLESKILLQTPLYRDKDNSLSISLLGSELTLDKSIPLSSGTNIPTHYYKTDLGINFQHNLPENKSVGVRTTFGYNTDKPFHNGRDLSFSLSTSYSYKTSETSSWSLLLFISNNSPIANYIPIPGFIYTYKTSTLTGMFGFPFAFLQWRPEGLWSYSLSVFGINLSTEAVYGPRDSRQFFTGLSWLNQSYILHDRVNRKDRLSFEDKKIFLGLRSPLTEKFSSEIQLGESFKRKVYIGNSMRGHQLGEATIPSSLYLSALIKYLF